MRTYKATRQRTRNRRLGWNSKKIQRRVTRAVANRHAREMERNVKLNALKEAVRKERIKKAVERLGK